MLLIFNIKMKEIRTSLHLYISLRVLVLLLWIPIQGVASCNPGYYSDDSAKCVDCPPASYCPGNGRFDCPAGTFSQAILLTSVDLCGDCPRGEYSLAGRRYCQYCPVGYFCPNARTGTPVPCDNGYYATRGASVCTICPTGHSCSAATDPVMCNLGEYSAEGSMECLPCRMGFYCPRETGSENECERGFYSKERQSECSSCPPGYYCPDALTGNPTPCPENTFSTGGAVSCSICPAGFSCRPYEHPVQCKHGEFSPEGSMICTRCRPGFYCGYRAGTEKECSRGYYSLEGQSECTPCPAGHYCPHAQANSSIPCPENAYSTGSAVSCSICPASFSCRPYEHPAECEDGEFSPAGSMICTRCRPGFYCGYKAGTEKECSRGSYSLEGQSECTPCPAGHYCPHAQANSSIPCPENSYSTYGAISCTICPIGHSCRQNEMPIQCEDGEYSSLGSLVCTLCSPGYYCPSKTDAPLVCLRGTYSSGGSKECRRCPSGTYCNSDATAAIPCPENTYSTGEANSCTICPAGHSCTPTSLPAACRDGEYSPLESMTCNQCRPGTYCVEYAAKELPCPGGSSSSAGQVTCTPCEEGQACPKPPIQINCDEGYCYDDNSDECVSCSSQPPSFAPVMTIHNANDVDDTSTNVGFALKTSHSVSLEDGQRVLVKCRVDGGYPAVSDVTITCMDQSKMALGTVASLPIEANMSMNQGKCVCSANHVSGSYNLTSEFTISILYGPPSIFLQIPWLAGDKVELMDGESMGWQCGADGNPAPMVSIWPKGPRLHIFSESSPHSDMASFSYGIVQAKCGNTDVYKCTASNYIGFRERTFVIFAKCSPQLIPDLTDNDKEFISRKGGDLKISIPVIGYPAPSDFTLTRRGQDSDEDTTGELKDGLYQAFFIDGDEHASSGTVVLNMLRLLTNDSGLYVLTISNGIGDGTLYFFGVTVITDDQATCPLCEKELPYPNPSTTATPPPSTTQMHCDDGYCYDANRKTCDPCSQEPPSLAPLMTIRNANDIDNTSAIQHVDLALETSHSVSLRINQRVLVNCHVDGGYPAVSDVTITCMDQSKTVSGTVASLPLEADMSVDQGKCVCSANHITGKYDRTSKFTIKILYGPSGISLRAHTEPGTDEIKEGQDVTLECGATGYPAPTLTIREQHSMQLVGVQELRPFGDMTSLIQAIVRPQCGKADVYTCTAHNGLGFTEDTISLFVKCPPQLLSDLIDNDREIISSKGGDLEIKIPVIGYPAPSDFTLTKLSDRRKRDTTGKLEGGLYKVRFVHGDGDGYSGAVVLNMLGLLGSDSGQYVLAIHNGIGDGLLYRFGITVITGNETCRDTEESDPSHESESTELDVSTVIGICAGFAVLLCIIAFLFGWNCGGTFVKRKAKKENGRHSVPMAQPSSPNTIPSHFESTVEEGPRLGVDTDNSEQQQQQLVQQQQQHERHKIRPHHQQQQHQQHQQAEQHQYNERNSTEIHVNNENNTHDTLGREPEEVDDKTSEYYVELDSIPIALISDNNTGGLGESDHSAIAEPSPEHLQISISNSGQYNAHDMTRGNENQADLSGYEVPTAIFGFSDSETRGNEENDLADYSYPSDQNLKYENFQPGPTRYVNAR